jgi:hypothetical protein
VRPDVEATIAHFYPERRLANPSGNRAIVWSYDPKNTTLKAIVSELEALAPTRAGTRGRYDLSEELEIGALRLQLSYLGPYAALNYGITSDVDLDGALVDRQAASDVRRILDRHRVQLLTTSELDEQVPWIGTYATVWNCLFVLPTPPA